MFQSFVIMLREGFEAFLIVSVMFAYLKKTGQNWLLPAVYWGIGVSVLTSVSLGIVLYRGVNGPLWEGILGLVAAIMVTSLVVYMWKHGSQMTKEMEVKLEKHSGRSTKWLSFIGIFLFTVLMITREGMETALLLIQVPQGRIFAGVTLGLLATASFAFLWVRFSSLINIKLFFQVTGIFLLLFVAQILIYSFHEFTEARIFPNSEYFHLVTEPFSPDGLYGKWFSIFAVLICSAWLILARIKNSLQRAPEGVPAE